MSKPATATIETFDGNQVTATIIGEDSRGGIFGSCTIPGDRTVYVDGKLIGKIDRNDPRTLKAAIEQTVQDWYYNAAQNG